MYIKLTKLDGRSVWLNASFIVTIEPRRDGNGAVVVPIGDGLDYDVKESPETVLRMLEGAPVPTVVPVPVSDCLTKTPVDVSPEPEERRPETRPPEPAKKQPESQPVAAKKEPADQSVAAGEPPAAEKKPRKRTTRAKAKTAKDEAKKEAEKPSAAEEAKTEPPKPVPPKPMVFELSPDQVARLAKLAPKSIAKLKNTLATQFHIADIGGTVLALEAKGAFTLEGNRVIWPTPVADW